MAGVNAVPVIWCPHHKLVTVATATVANCDECQSLAADYRRQMGRFSPLERLRLALRPKPDRRQTERPRRKDRRKHKHPY